MNSIPEAITNLIPYGTAKSGNNLPVPGKLNANCTSFVGLDGLTYNFIDRLMFNKLYPIELKRLITHYVQFSLKEINDELEFVYQSSVPEYVPPFSLRNYNFLPEELDIMAQRSSVKIKFTTDMRVTKEEIYKNGGMIPVKSPIRFNISAGKAFTIKSGMCLDIPDGYAGMLLERKSFDTRGIELCGRIIHSTFKDEFEISLNNKDRDRIVEIGIGEEIAQIAIIPLKTNFELL